MSIIRELKYVIKENDERCNAVLNREECIKLLAVLETAKIAVKDRELQYADISSKLRNLELEIDRLEYE